MTHILLFQQYLGRSSAAFAEFLFAQAVSSAVHPKKPLPRYCFSLTVTVALKASHAQQTYWWPGSPLKELKAVFGLQHRTRDFVWAAGEGDLLPLAEYVEDLKVRCTSAFLLHHSL